ncbi:MAG: nuclear transport factor 2 family protein [Capnocytophaga sp.]|nr:nuclear transport factor 2 family protein [Capnocytophaga sp.]
MKEILETYYKGFAQKSGWEETLADDFVFVMNDKEEFVGKAMYLEMYKNFSLAYQTMRVSRTIIEGENACVIANYDWILPNGETHSTNVVEIWKAENGLLKELKTYFNDK